MFYTGRIQKDEQNVCSVTSPYLINMLTILIKKTVLGNIESS